jgi:hypothetical protein
MFLFKNDLSKFFNPRYYNIITYLLVLCGIGLLSSPLWRDSLESILNKVGVNIPNSFHPVYGIILICITLFFNWGSQYINLALANKGNIPQKEISKCKEFENFKEICQALIPLVDDNKYIFETYGPNSSAANIGELRTDMELWHQSRKDYIVPNNELINCIINKNKSLIPSKHQELFNKLNSHIYAFKKHVENPNFDYTTHQFPASFDTTIKDVCFEENLIEKDFIKITKWLDRRVCFNGVAEKRIFGSFLFSTSNSKDIDLVILLDENAEVSKISKHLKRIEYQAKLKFKKPIHTSVFLYNEQDNYTEFVQKNKYNYQLNGKKFTLFDFAFC